MYQPPWNVDHPDYPGGNPTPHEYPLGHSDPFTGPTVATHGCALISLDMVLNYAFSSAGKQTINPVSLNQFLTNSDCGYVPGTGKLNWGPATSIAGLAVGAHVQWHAKTTTDTQELRDLITQNAAPVIAKVGGVKSESQHLRVPVKASWGVR
jgi:hypothetical protein